jgi:hypothetical protein
METCLNLRLGGGCHRRLEEDGLLLAELLARPLAGLLRAGGGHLRGRRRHLLLLLLGVVPGVMARLPREKKSFLHKLGYVRRLNNSLQRW